MNTNELNPQLQKLYNRIPSVPFHKAWFLKLLQLNTKWQSKPKVVAGMAIKDYNFGNAGVRVYQPEGETSGAGLLWIHGGGYIIGSPAINDRECVNYAKKLNITVVSVKYRLAPKHPFPAASDDCFAAWQWFQDKADDLGVAPTRIAISGQSAGGGLAAGLVQRIHDCGGIQPVGQALFYPMLDDRTAAQTELDALKHRLWNNKNNRGAWCYYLNQTPGLATVPAYSAPGRRENLEGLPPTWLGVGSVDLFFDEDQHYAARLGEAGVSCELKTVDGAPHAFDVIAPDVPISVEFLESNYHFLRRVLTLRIPPVRPSKSSPQRI
jgi:acetyl esterase/lipase